MIKYSILSALALLSLASCNVENRVGNTKELAQEMKTMQIKRVTNTQLISTVDEGGKQIAVVAQKSLEKELSTKPDEGAAICKDLRKVPIIDALDKEYSVKIH